MSTAGQAIGGVVGAVVGFFTPIGPLYGAQIGMAIGGYLDPPKGPRVEGPRLNDLSVQTSTYGAVIPRVYGTVALMGNVFWLEHNALKETAITTKSGGKGGPPKTTTTTYSYSATFAVGLCEGEIAGVRRIWVGNRLIYDVGSDDMATIIASNAAASGFTLYTGSETQAADPRMQATLGVANTPAYRGLAYLVFEDFALANYGNSLMGAQIKAEVVKMGSAGWGGVASTLPSGGYCYEMVWTGSSYVSVSASGSKSFTSFDGQTWSQHAMPTDQYLCMAWSGATLCCPRFGDSVTAVSPDGISWTTGNINLIAAWTGIAYGNGVFCAVASDHAWTAISGDGVAWTGSTSALNGMTGGCSSIAYGNGVFVALGYGSGNNKVYVSADGLVWTQYALPSVGDWRAIVFNGEIFCAVSIEGFRSAISSDGTSWTAGSTLPSLSSGSPWLAWGGGYFVTAHNAAASVSADGLNWTAVSLPVSANWGCGAWNGGVFALNPIGGSTATTTLRPDTIVLGATTLADIVEAEIVASGLLSLADINAGALTDTVRGYRIASVAAIRAGLEPLQGAFPFDVVQAGYLVDFRPRGGTAVATIAAGDLGAHPAGDKAVPGLTIEREMDSVLPRRVSIKHLDYSREYDIGEQYAERLNTDSINIKEMELALVLTATEAAQIAENLLYLYWLERYRVRFTLPPTFNSLEPADVVTVNADSGAYECRITSITYATDGRLEVAARYNAAAIYTPAAAGEEGGAASGSVVYDGPTKFELIDCALLDDDHDTAGFILAASGATTGWPGGGIYRSDDGGASYDLAYAAWPPGSVIGVCGSPLASHDGRMPDSAGALIVNLWSGKLESISFLRLLNGANHFAYGADGRWEILAARTCTLQGDGSWLLTDLLRGRFGTEWATGLHAGADRLVALDRSALNFLSVNSSTIGLARLWKGVTVGQMLDAAPPLPFTYRGANLKPLAPVYLNGNRNPSTNDWTLDWIRRTRLGGEWRDAVDASLGETVESYEIEVWTSGFAALKRTLTSAAPTVAYTSAQQVADFGSNQAALSLKIYQLSSVVGRGTALATTITR